MTSDRGAVFGLAPSSGWDPWKGVGLEAGLSSLLDRDHPLSTGYPLAVSTRFAHIRYRL